VVEDYIISHAQEMDPSVIQQHIDLYVNRFSRDLGDEGAKSCEGFAGSCREGTVAETLLFAVDGLLALL